jgi:stage III sporulation protein AB
VGAMMVISCCSIIGMGFAAELKNRVKSLTGLISALTIMKSEICDLLTPMPELLRLIAEQSSIPVKTFFENCLAFLTEGRTVSFSKAWEYAARETVSMQLTPDEVSALSELGLSLGRYDIDEQKTALTRTINKLEIYMARAEEEKRRKGKVCAAMGVSTGLMIAIIMV